MHGVDLVHVLVRLEVGRGVARARRAEVVHAVARAGGVARGPGERERGAHGVEAAQLVEHRRRVRVRADVHDAVPRGERGPLRGGVQRVARPAVPFDDDLLLGAMPWDCGR